MSMENSDFGPRDYSDGRTKQAFKDQCDINKILKKAQKSGTISHLLKYPEPVYGDFDGVDLLEAHRLIDKAQTIFDDLPSEIRREFDGDALKFAGFASDPANRGKLAQLLPKIAEPGAYFPNPAQRGGVGAGAATAPVEDAPVQEAPNVPDKPSEPSSEA
jgi:hypothetical protein